MLRAQGSLTWLCPAPRLGRLLLHPRSSHRPGQPPFPSSHISWLRGSSSRCVSCLLCAEAARELPALSPDAPFPNETPGLSQDHGNPAKPWSLPAARPAQSLHSTASSCALDAPRGVPHCPAPLPGALSLQPGPTLGQEPSRHLRLHFQNAFPHGEQHRAGRHGQGKRGASLRGLCSPDGKDTQHLCSALALSPPLTPSPSLSPALPHPHPPHTGTVALPCIHQTRISPDLP